MKKIIFFSGLINLILGIGFMSLSKAIPKKKGGLKNVQKEVQNQESQAELLRR